MAGVLLTWIIVGQEPNVLAFGAAGDCLDYKYLSWVYGMDRNICHEDHSSAS